MTGRAATATVIPGRAALSVGMPDHDPPTGWIWTSLYAAAELGTGHTPSRSIPEYWNGDIPWIGIRDAGKHHGGLITRTLQSITSNGLANSSARLLPKGTVCLSRTASVGYVVQMGRDMATSQDFVTWTCDQRALEPRFLMYALLAEGDDIRRFGKGSTHTTIYFPEVKALHICLPPIAEQRRIVAKLDALTTRTARARADLDRIPALAARYKQAVLKLAFTGALPGTTPGAGERWGHAPIASLADVGTGSTPKRGEPRFYVGGTIPWLTSSAVNNPRVTSANEYITDAALRETNCKIFEPGTLLMAMYGEGQTRGRIAVLDISAATNQAIAAISVRKNAPIRPAFLLWFLRSRYLQLRREASGGVQPNLNLGIVKATIVPLPALSEQDLILRRVTTALAEIDRLTAEAAAARRLLDRLDQAILSKAFRGELVPQNPADEPASVLLERIKSERAGAPKASRRGRPAKAA